MSSIIVDCTSAQDALSQLNAFLVVGHTLPPIYMGTGNGYVDDAIGTAASIYEIITITFSSATNFTVAGSISGGLGAGMVGTLFASTVIKFTAQELATGSVPWADGDTITMQMTAPWQAKVLSPGSQYLWFAPGNDNNSVIRVGLTTASDSTGGYFTARTWMFPYWSDATYTLNNQWSAQFKAVKGSFWPLGSGATQDVRLIARADGNFCYAVAVIGTTMSAVSMGFFDSFHTRDFYQYPCIIGGSLGFEERYLPASTSTAWKWSDSNLRYPLFGSDRYAESHQEYMELRTLAGVRYDYDFVRYSTLVSPDTGALACSWGFTPNPDYAKASLTYGSIYGGAYMRNNLDGSVPLWPVYIYMGRRSDGSPNRFTGTLGKYPFVGRIPAYDANGVMLVKQQMFRDPNTRRRIIAVTGGALEDASNFYGLELA